MLSDAIRVNRDLNFHGLHTAATAGFSSRQGKYEEENHSDSSSLKSAHTTTVAATAGLSPYPEYGEEYLSDSESSSSQSEEEDDISDTSLSDFYPEEYPLTASESEDSKEDDDRSGMDLDQSTATTPQSALYPNKRRKEEEEDTLSEGKDYTGYCEVKKPLEFPPESDLSSQYVPWLSESSHSEYVVPKKKDWIESWPSEKVKEQKGYNYLSVYGFYSSKTGFGGYGVMLRDPCGRPVVAAACVQPQGKFYFYHVLDGVRAGLALALKHEMYNLQLMCNSETLDDRLRQIFQQADAGSRRTRRTRYQCGACDRCLRFVIPLSDKEFEIVVPLLREIIQTHSKIRCKSGFFHVTNSTYLNRAAYHVVKQLASEMKSATEPKTVIIKPSDFGKKLKTILFEDAYLDPKVYSQQLQ